MPVAMSRWSQIVPALRSEFRGPQAADINLNVTNLLGGAVAAKTNSLPKDWVVILNSAEDFTDARLQVAAEWLVARPDFTLQIFSKNISAAKRADFQIKLSRKVKAVRRQKGIFSGALKTEWLDSSAELARVLARETDALVIGADRAQLESFSVRAPESKFFVFDDQTDVVDQAAGWLAALDEFQGARRSSQKVLNISSLLAARAGLLAAVRELFAHSA